MNSSVSIFCQGTVTFTTKELYKSLKMFVNSTEKYEETNNEQTNVFNLKLQIDCGAFRKSCY